MLTTLLLVGLGAFTWTFLEYVIHRFRGHKKNGKGPVRKEHLQHHAKANYFVQLYKKIPIAIAVLVMSAIIVGAIAGLINGLAFAFGLAGMYFIYELTHRAFHVREPFIRYGLKMRKHHFYHHFGNPKNNHGVTTALWDRIFKTYQTVEQVAVPPKMVMQWLLNEEHTVKGKYRDHFRLR